MIHNSITVSAPGKLMLFGEHAVLAGYPCIVTAVNKRMYVTVKIISSPELIIYAPDMGIQDYKKPIKNIGKGNTPRQVQFVERATKNFIKNFSHGIKITTSSEFSSHLGFGSSAAVTVAVVKALSEIFNLKLPKKEIFNLSLHAVLNVQKRASGFDVAASVYGKTIYHKKNETPIKINSLSIIVGYSGVKADTVTLMQNVEKKFSQNKKELQVIYASIAQIVDKAKYAMQKNNWKTVGKLMTQNQLLLQNLGVSTKKLDAMVIAAIKAGAYGAKLSGAGGGDCMIAVVPEDKRVKIEKAIKKVGGKVIKVKTNAEGVRVE